MKYPRLTRQIRCVNVGAFLLLKPFRKHLVCLALRAGWERYYSSELWYCTRLALGAWNGKILEEYLHQRSLTIMRIVCVTVWRMGYFQVLTCPKESLSPEIYACIYTTYTYAQYLSYTQYFGVTGIILCLTLVQNVSQTRVAYFLYPHYWGGYLWRHCTPTLYFCVYCALAP